MKNISLTVSPNPIYPVSPPPMPQSSPQFASTNVSKLYNISFSAQFADEAAAVMFASKLLAMVNGDNE